MTGDLGIDTDGSFVTMGEAARKRWEQRSRLHHQRVREAVTEWQKRGFPETTLVCEQIGPKEEVTPSGAIKRFVHSWVHPKGQGLDFPRYCFPRLE